MTEYFILLCLVAIVKGIATPRDSWTEASRHGSKSTKPLKDNLQMATSDQKEAETGHHGHDFGGLGHGHHGGYFHWMDIWQSKMSPTQYELGHVEETPNGWEQRFERVDGHVRYAHNPDYGHYEFGYRRGNDYHFQERYEKAHDWKFKTKAKWGDKYGGYGEHYWDYNHVDKGYGGDHGHGGGGDGGHGHGHYSEQVPVVSEPDRATKNSRIVQKRESKRKENQETGEMGSTLSLDPVTGKVTDKDTGKTYWLKPTEDS